MNTEVTTPSTPPGRAWYIVSLLTLLYCFSFIDRFILALLVEPVGAEFDLADSEMGLLLGIGFALVYSAAGIPLANLIDQKKRRNIVFAGTMLWSVATIGSGFATNFETLLVLRAAVAIGEAVLSPAAISLIADMFPRKKRGPPVALYASVASIMGFGAFLIGGLAFDLATILEPTVALSPWRSTLILVGLPSMLLSLIFLFTVKEPPRTGSEDTQANTDLSTFVAYFKERALLFGTAFLAIGIAVIVNYGVVSWTPTLLVRAYGADPAEAGYLVGLTIGPASIIGAFVWPIIARRLTSEGTENGPIRAMMAGTAIGMIFMLTLIFVENLVATLTLLSLAMWALSAYGVLLPLFIQAYGQSRMRARLMATYLLCTNVIGASLGPLATPLVAEHISGERTLLMGMIILSAIILPIVLLLFWVSLRRSDAAALADADRVFGS